MKKLYHNMQPLLRCVAAVTACAVFGMFAVPAAAAEVKLDYLYNLSDFTGTLPSSWVRFGMDQAAGELYVLNSSDQSISVFNSAGVLVYSFGDDGDLGYVSGLVFDETGTMYLLSSSGKQFRILKASFRGDLQGPLDLRGLPPLFRQDFLPDRIFCQEGYLYLVDTRSFKVLKTDLHGMYVDGFEFGSLLKVNDKKRSDYAIRGFSMDRDGSFIFTIPVLSQVFILSPDRRLDSFGTRGSSPGKFNVIGGVAADDRNLLYVADTLRCVIMVFERNKNYTFRGEFGYRGFEPGNLIAPLEIAVLHDKLYVSQSANRGVSVYRITVK